jgi:hypothetical protein
MNHYSSSTKPAPVAPRARTHELPIWPACFAAVSAGTKPFDVRENSLDFQVGDALILREFDPDTNSYSGQTIVRWVSHILPGGTFGVEEGWCVLGLGALAPLPAGITDTKLW